MMEMPLVDFADLSKTTRTLDFHHGMMRQVIRSLPISVVRNLGHVPQAFILAHESDVYVTQVGRAQQFLFQIEKSLFSHGPGIAKPSDLVVEQDSVKTVLSLQFSDSRTKLRNQ